jgi:excisionase family DNA binding protein
MSKRPLDLKAIQQANANLGRLARENPHLIDPTRANWTEEDIAEMVLNMGQPAYTLEDAAELLQCHPQTLRRAVKDGSLRAAKVGKNYVISRPDLEAYYQAKGGGQLFKNEG